MVDCDAQQGNATLFLGHNPNQLQITIATVISIFLDLGKTDVIHEAILHQSENFDLLLANPKLEAIQNRIIVERNIAGLFGTEEVLQPHEVLKKILEGVRTKYDYVIIDCPLSISMLSINALVAADSVLLPVEAHYECHEALVQTLDVKRKIKANWNPYLEIEGILLTKYQSRTRLCNEITAHTRKNFGSKVHIIQYIK